MRIIALLIILSGYMIAQDTLVTNAGVVYIGAFHGIDESSTTFQAEGSPAPSVLPNRLISKIILHGGTLVFADSSMMVENLAAAPPRKSKRLKLLMSNHEILILLKTYRI